MDFKCRTCGEMIPDKAMAEIHVMTRHLPRKVIEQMMAEHIVRCDDKWSDDK